MRLTCPNCGPRDSREFTYLGDARLCDRPDGNADDPAVADADLAAAFHEYVHLRDNPTGAHAELWHHGLGCRAWLRVTRNVSTHAVIDTALAGDRA